MENIDKILEVLNEALRSKDIEIGSLKYLLKQAEMTEKALDETIERKNAEIARLEAEITKLTTERGAE